MDCPACECLLRSDAEFPLYRSPGWRRITADTADGCACSRRGPGRPQQAGGACRPQRLHREPGSNRQPAVVQISARSRAPMENGESGRAGFVSNRETSGSGIIVESDGYIITNAHVLFGAHHIDVSVFARAGTDPFDDHKHFQARIAGVDNETDIALLKI